MNLMKIKLFWTYIDEQKAKRDGIEKDQKTIICRIAKNGSLDIRNTT